MNISPLGQFLVDSPFSSFTNIGRTRLLFNEKRVEGDLPFYSIDCFICHCVHIYNSGIAFIAEVFSKIVPENMPYFNQSRIGIILWVFNKLLQVITIHFMCNPATLFFIKLHIPILQVLILLRGDMKTTTYLTMQRLSVFITLLFLSVSLNAQIKIKERVEIKPTNLK
jgi:hypothetical protein